MCTLARPSDGTPKSHSGAAVAPSVGDESPSRVDGSEKPDYLCWRTFPTPHSLRRAGPESLIRRVSVATRVAAAGAFTKLRAGAMFRVDRGTPLEGSPKSRFPPRAVLSLTGSGNYLEPPASQTAMTPGAGRPRDFEGSRPRPLHTSERIVLGDHLGRGRFSVSSRDSSLSQVMSRLALSRATSRGSAMTTRVDAAAGAFTKLGAGATFRVLSHDSPQRGVTLKCGFRLSPLRGEDREDGNVNVRMLPKSFGTGRSLDIKEIPPGVDAGWHSITTPQSRRPSRGAPHALRDYLEPGYWSEQRWPAASGRPPLRGMGRAGSDTPDDGASSNADSTPLSRGRTRSRA